MPHAPCMYVAGSKWAPLATALCAMCAMLHVWQLVSALISAASPSFVATAAGTAAHVCLMTAATVALSLPAFSFQLPVERQQQWLGAAATIALATATQTFDRKPAAAAEAHTSNSGTDCAVWHATCCHCRCQKALIKIACNGSCLPTLHMPNENEN